MESYDRVGYPLTLRATVAGSGESSGISLLMTAEDEAIANRETSTFKPRESRAAILVGMLEDLRALLERICDAAVDFKSTPRGLLQWLYERSMKHLAERAANRAQRLLGGHDSVQNRGVREHRKIWSDAIANPIDSCTPRVWIAYSRRC